MIFLIFFSKNRINFLDNSKFFSRPKYDLVNFPEPNFFKSPHAPIPNPCTVQFAHDVFRHFTIPADLLGANLVVKS